MNQAVTTTSSTTSKVITMPASIVAGNLLLCFLVQNGAVGQAGFTGWTALFTGTTGTGCYLRAYVKVAVGGDTATDTNTSAPTGIAAVTYQISGATSTIGNIGFITSSSSADPPSLTPTFGSADYLWFACAAAGGTTTAYTAAPTSYSNLQTCSPASSTAACAQRALTGTTENPGTFTGGTGGFSSGSCTIAVPPVSVSGTPTRLNTPLIPRLRSFNW